MASLDGRYSLFMAKAHIDDVAVYKQQEDDNYHTENNIMVAAFADSMVEIMLTEITNNVRR